MLHVKLIQIALTTCTRRFDVIFSCWDWSDPFIKW